MQFNCLLHLLDFSFCSYICHTFYFTLHSISVHELLSPTGSTWPHWSQRSRRPSGTERRDWSSGQSWTSWPQGESLTLATHSIDKTLTNQLQIELVSMNLYATLRWSKLLFLSFCKGTHGYRRRHWYKRTSGMYSYRIWKCICLLNTFGCYSAEIQLPLLNSTG